MSGFQNGLTFRSHRLLWPRTVGALQGRGYTVDERRSGGWSGLRKADRIALVMVGVGIVVINAILIALLF